MALAVWKYEFPMVDEFTMELPEDAQILTVQVQPAAGGVRLWALVNAEHPMRPRHFRLAGTGHPIESEMHELRFIGSFQLDDGALVFHLFEVVSGPF
jgi:hypothetical protein